MQYAWAEVGRSVRLGGSVGNIILTLYVLAETTQMESLSPAVSTTVDIFTDLKTYLSPAVSTTVKVYTLLYSYTYTVTTYSVT